jgi:hypothetical protein
MEEKDIEFEMLSFLYENRDKNCTRDEMFNSFAGRVSQEVLSKIELEMRNKNYSGTEAGYYRITKIGIHQLDFLKKEIKKEQQKEKRDLDVHFYTKWTFILGIITALLAILALIKCDANEEKHTGQIIEQVQMCKIRPLQLANPLSYIS